MKKAIEEYREYLKDNPEGYWFKRKAFGWGWTPVTREGWFVILLYAAGLLFFAFTIDEDSPPQEIMFTFFLPITLLTVTLIIIAYKKGEKPQWTWGFPKKSKREEDEDRQ